MNEVTNHKNYRSNQSDNLKDVPPRKPQRRI